VTLRWHLPDGAVQVDAAGFRVTADLACGRATLSIQGAAGLHLDVPRGTEASDRVYGWESAYYGELAPRPTVEATTIGESPVRLVTRIALGEDAG
jgi:hypothetical protein